MPDTVVLDACCLINLAAAGALETWLSDLALKWVLPEAVLGEALLLRASSGQPAAVADADPSEPVPEPITLAPHIASGLLTVIRPETDAELAAYVAFARELDDGEAMALAIAECRGWRLATDDRKAMRLAGAAGVSVLTTSMIVKQWADQRSPTATEIRVALIAVRDRARFLPGGRDPLWDWWIERLNA
jgi:hypothetical protein